MKRVILLLMMLVAPAAFAQQLTDGSPAEGIVVPAPSSGSGVVLLADTPSQAPSQAARAEPPRRRPSMVGYVGDSTVGSQLRVRVDAGRNLVAADRAEFFYGKCGCYRSLPANHPYYDPKAAGPGASEFALTTSLNFRQLNILGEYAVRDWVSIFAELPVRWLRPQSFSPAGGTFGDQSGASDLRAGVKFGALSTDQRRITIQLVVTAPTGDSSSGLGTDHASVEPVLLYSEQMSDRFGIEAQFGDVIATGGSAGLPTSGPKKFSGSVLYYGIGPSFDLYSNDRLRFAPVVELVGWHLLGGFETLGFAAVKGMNIVNLKVGGRVAVRDKNSFYFGYGHALTDNTWYEDIFRFEYRFSF